MGKRATVVLVASFVALSACSGGSNSAGAPPSRTVAPSTTTTVSPAPTTTPTPEFSFDDSVPPPKLVNTGTDYVAILKSLESYANWLAGHRPNPELASTVLATGTKVSELFARDLARLRANKKREVEELGTSPTTYEILSATPDAFSAKVVEDIVVHRVVSSSGKVTSQVRYSGLTTYLELAVRIDGRWRLAAVDAQNPSNLHR